MAGGKRFSRDERGMRDERSARATRTSRESHNSRNSRNSRAGRAGRNAGHDESRETPDVRSAAADFERYVSRGSNRAFVVVVIFLAFAALFFVRLFYLQVIMAPQYTAEAQAARTVGFMVEPRRGTIYDRNGHILAISADATTIYANPSEITEPGATARAIAEVLGGTASDYLDAVSQGENSTFTFIARKADSDLAERLKEEELPGIYFIADTRREYPYGKVGGQVIGACSVAVDEEHNREYYDGICGMELYYNTILSGTPGYYEAEVGADGTPIPGGVHESKAAVEGQDIVISIDIEFQEEVERDLAEDLKRVGVPSGSAVVMDATSGEIYAAASCPSFNPADRTNVPEGSMQLKAITNLFEPGSIFKTVSATAILEAETMTPETVIDVPASLEADGYVVTDAYEHEHDPEHWSLRTIINKSSNIGISLSVEKYLGFQDFYNAILQYRFDELTGVDYPGEQLGYILDFDFWSRVQGYNVTFGQGISMNAMQILAFYGALINNGWEVTPHFLLRKPQTAEVPEWPTHEIIKNKNAIAPMTSMLQTVVTDGTGTNAAIEGYDAAGKTSTAEIFDMQGGYRVDAVNIAFTGFIANSNSPFVCFCGADEVPADRNVTPMFSAIMTDAINRYNIVAE